MNDQPNRPSPPPDNTAMRRVREIIVGESERDWGQRLERVEALIHDEAAELRAEFNRRFDELEGFVRNELDSLRETQSSERVAVQELRERLQEAQRLTREQLLKQSKDLSEEIRRKHEAGSRALDSAAQELRHQKADRQQLAALLADLSMRLSENPAEPPAETDG